MSDTVDTNRKFSDYLYILYKWRKFLIINTIIVIILSSVYAFLLPLYYKSTAVVMMPPESSLGLGGLSGLLGGKSGTASLGARLLGVGGGSEDVLLGILNSRTAITNVIDEFDLVEYYEIDDNIDKVIKAFTGDLNFELNEHGMIEISVINKDPQLAADIANYFVGMLDSLNIRFNTEQAKNNRGFIEKRYFQNKYDLKSAEDSLYKFQRKYGIVAVPEQLEVSVKAAAEIESQLIRKEMESYFLLQQFGENSPQYLGILSELNLIRAKIKELKESPDLSATSNILFPFSKMPDISIQYLRTFREVEIQQSILEFIMPMYEQAMIEEQKSIPTVLVLDKAVPPQLKDSPKRAFIILAISFLTFFFTIVVSFLGEKALTRTTHNNILEQKISRFFVVISKFYRIKI